MTSEPGSVASPESAATLHGQGDPIEAAEVGLDVVDAMTPDPEKTEAAAKLIAHLFEVMGIKRVVSVDDDYEGNLPQLLTLVARLVDAGSSTFAEIIDLEVPDEIWEVSLTDFWEQSTTSEQRGLLASAKKQAGVEDQQEQPDVSFLRPLLPPDDVVEFVAYTPDEWQESRRAVIEEAKNLPTLVLLDRQMGNSNDAGIRLAETIFDEDHDGKVFVGLLTRTIAKGDEHFQWKKLSEDNAKLKPERFVVMSKDNLGPDPEAFAQPIKLVLMAIPAEKLREEMRATIALGIDHAFSRMLELSPQEFEKMIFGVSMKEGVWEPESLLRVFQILMRQEVRKVMYESRDMRANANVIRELCAVTPPAPPETAAAIVVAQAERYDQGDHLNPIYLPVESGDVFETASGSHWVLVEQPCDFMVRSDGTRAPEMFDAYLLPIKDSPPSAQDAGYKLDFYYEDGRPAWAHLNRACSVPVEALDLVAANANGRSSYTMNMEAPAGMWPAWALRFNKVAERLNGTSVVLSDLEKLGKGQMKSTLRTRLVETLFAGHKRSGRKIGVTVDEAGTLKYDLERVRRILQPHSRALLLEYSRFRARDAFDPDLASRQAN